MNRKHFRRIFSAVLTLIMVFTLMVPFANAASANYLYYSDVTGNSTQTRAINYLHEHGIVGQPFTAVAARKATIQANKFAPKQAITRLQLVHAMWKMYGSPNVVESTIRMRDVYTNTDHLTAMRWAVGTGILDSVTSGSYAPDEALSIEEVMLMLYRFVDYCGYDVSYSKTMLPRQLGNKEIDHAINWGLSKGFITALTAKGDYTADCSRGNVATYLYKIYEIYQKKYGLTVVRTHNLKPAAQAGRGMANMFRYTGAETISREDIYYDEGSNSFVSSMDAAFSKARALDICYLFCYSHGGKGGLGLFCDGALTPGALRAEIDEYNGTFVVFIAGCNTGTYITKGANDTFDAQSFVAGLTTTSSSKRSATNMVDESGRIKVICSSRQTEPSYNNGVTSYAPHAWLVGCGMARDAWAYYFSGNGLPADVDKNRKISMAELFDYAYETVVNRSNDKQHMVCYPENDDTIIFERRDWEFMN